MASNDEVVIGMPMLLCPSCKSALNTSTARFEKRSKKQRQKDRDNRGSMVGGTSFNQQWPEDQESEESDTEFIVVSCGVYDCSQYNKFKVVRVPRIETPSTKVTL